jgi:chromosome segregation ATPase
MRQALLLSRLALTLAVLGAALSGAACDAVYYKTMKKFGVEKRDILVNRVRDAREAQRKGKEEFKTALERFKAVVETDGGTLEDKYNKLNKELERSEDRAKDIHDRVKAVKNVADDLFDEWQKELGKYNDRQLRAESERELRETKRRAEAVIKAMETVDKRVDPVLQPLRDRVLFLKHNLNASAIGALDKELVALRTNVDALIADMESSIAEAEAFINQMDAEAKATS